MKSNKEIAEILVNTEIDGMRKHWTLENVQIQIEETKEFTFVVFHADIKESSDMHRYGMYCIRGFEIVFRSSNVINKNQLYTIDDVKTQTRNFFTYYLGLIDNDKPVILKNRLTTMITFKVPSKLYGATDCVITDIDHTLKTGYAPCGDGCDYKLTTEELQQLARIRSGQKIEFTPTDK